MSKLKIHLQRSDYRLFLGCVRLARSAFTYVTFSSLSAITVYSLRILRQSSEGEEGVEFGQERERIVREERLRLEGVK